MITERNPSALISSFLWIGFVCAISFMEAWLKFRAPNVSIPVGLGIGRLVFGALNKVEWVFAAVIVINLLSARSGFLSLRNLFYYIPTILLIVQTIWILPALDVRAEQYIQGSIPLHSNLHFYYVGMEAVKVICLMIFGLSLFKRTANSCQAESNRNKLLRN